METLATVKSEQNIAIAQKGFADFLKGNIAAIIEASAEDVTWGSYENAVVPFAGMFHGRKGIADFFSTLSDTVDYKVFDPGDYYADNDSVLVKGYQEAIVKSTGKTFGHDFLMHFKMRDGKIASFFAYVDSKDEAQAFSK